eukprot:jgi/Psemu1/58691/gm1.58691_g
MVPTEAREPRKSKRTHPSTTAQQKQHRNNSIPQRGLHDETPLPMSMLGSEDSNRDETNASALKKKLNKDTLWKLDVRNREVGVMKEKMEEMAEQEATASVTEDDGMTTNSEKANQEILTQHCATNLEEEMKQYVKTSWFCGVKFVTDNDWAELILKEGIASKQGVTKPNIPGAQFYAYNNCIEKLDE